MVFGTLFAFFAINLRIYILYGPPGWQVVFGFTAAGTTALVYGFVLFNRRIKSMRDTLAQTGPVGHAVQAKELRDVLRSISAGPYID
jgi:hypothetical protein